MLRPGFNDEPLPEEDSHPLFGAEAQKMLAAIEASDVWVHLKAGLTANREALFASKPVSTEDLWRTWGAIETLTMLLHTGPATVLQYNSLARKVEESTQEDRYVAQVAMFDGV